MAARRLPFGMATVQPIATTPGPFFSSFDSASSTMPTALAEAEAEAEEE